MSASWSHNQIKVEVSLGATQGDGGPQWTLAENLSSRKQRRKALNMESQHGFRKGQYNSPLPVSVQVPHLPVSVSLLHL